MKHLISKNYTLLWLIMLLLSYQANSQTNTLHASIHASGYTATGQTGTVSYSIGQLFYTYLGDQDQSVAQGIQQAATTEQGEDLPEDIDVETPEISIAIFPNPATDFVTLATTGISFQNQVNSYQLFNYQGQLIMQNSITQDHTSINLTHLSTSIYILRVYVNNKLYNTYKILKK